VIDLGEPPFGLEAAMSPEGCAARGHASSGQAERRFTWPTERRLTARAVVVALALHAMVLAVDLPPRGEPGVSASRSWMQVRFLEPEPAKVQPPPRPAQRIPRPGPGETGADRARSGAACA
jgi:hypothetical protein